MNEWPVLRSSDSPEPSPRLWQAAPLPLTSSPAPRVSAFPREAAFYLLHFLQVQAGRRGGRGTPAAGWAQLPAASVWLAVCADPRGSVGWGQGGSLPWVCWQCLLRPYPDLKRLIFDYVLAQFN